MFPYVPTKPPKSLMQKILDMLKNGGPADQLEITRALFPKGASLREARFVLDDLRVLVQWGDIDAVDKEEHGVTWRTYRVSARQSAPLKTPPAVVRSSH